MRGKDGKLSFSEKGRKRIWKNLMGEIMNKGNAWDHMTEANLVAGSVEKVTFKEMAKAVKV